MRTNCLKHDFTRNGCMLKGRLAENGYDWWWHSFTGVSRKTGEERTFFIEYFLTNPALAQSEPTLGQLVANKALGNRPSYLMLKAGCWGKEKAQLHKFYSWDDISVRMIAPYNINAKDCFASDDMLRGSIDVSAEDCQAHPEWMCDAGRMKWALTVDKQIPFNVGYGAGKIMRAVNAFEMYWHVEGMKTEYKGIVMFNDELFDVTSGSSYGYADKNWGAGFTTPWVWLSSNDMFSNLTGCQLDNTVFDIGGGKPKIFGIGLNRILLGAMCYKGHPVEFNFSKFWTLPRTRFSCKETSDEIIWKVAQENAWYVMKTKVRCRKEDMLLVNYEAPDGSKKHNRLWNGGTGEGRILLYKKTSYGLELIDDISIGHVGCEYGEMS